MVRDGGLSRFRARLKIEDQSSFGIKESSEKCRDELAPNAGERVVIKVTVLTGNLRNLLNQGCVGTIFKKTFLEASLKT